MEYKIEYDVEKGILICKSWGETAKGEIIHYANEALEMVERLQYKRMLTDHRGRTQKSRFIDADFLIETFKDIKYPEGFKWAYVLDKGDKMLSFYRRYETEGSRVIQREIKIFFDYNEAVNWLLEK